MSTISWNGGSVTFAYGYTAGIQRELQRNNDDTPIAVKNNISFRGSIVASGNDTTARWINLLRAGGTAAGTGGNIGTLSYEGTTFENAILTGISVGEGSDDTAAAHFIDVTYTFEAISTTTGGNYIKNASETLEVRKETEQKTFSENDVEGSVFFGYTITYTISASGGLLDDQDAYTSAKSWVEGRIQESSIGLTITNNVAGDALTSPVPIEDMATLPESEYNVVKTISSDPVGGSYSVSFTFFRAKSSSSSDVNVDFQKDENGDVSVSVNGTIKGFSSGGANSTTDDSYANAESAFNTICGGFSTGSKVYSLASTAFGAHNFESVVLDDYPMSLSVGSNKLSGTKTFNVTYRAYPNGVLSLRNSIPNAISASLTITDDNKDGDVKVFASIPVIGRAEGPILQDMATTRERRRSVQVEATVKAASRVANNFSIVEACKSAALVYTPNGTQIFVSNSNGNWDFASGKASYSIEWTYQ